MSKDNNNTGRPGYDLANNIVGGVFALALLGMIFYFACGS